MGQLDVSARFWMSAHHLYQLEVQALRVEPLQLLRGVGLAGG